VTADGHAVTVPLRSRRHARVQLAQKIQHAVPAFGLIAGGATSLRAGARGFELVLAIGGIATSVLLIVAMVKALLGVRRRAVPESTPTHPHGIDWVDIWLAGVLFAEVGEHWHLRHHVARPVLLTAIVTLGLGLLHGRVTAARERRRVLRLTDEELVVASRPFRKFTARWDEIARIQMNEREALIQTHQGRQRRLDLTDLENAPDIRAALERARARLAP
jgi:hypothetical protein